MVVLGIGFEQDFVVDYIQFFLCFVLYVIGIGIVQYVIEGVFVDGDGDVGVGVGDDCDQLVQVGVDVVGVLFLDQEVG